MLTRLAILILSVWATVAQAAEILDVFSEDTGRWLAWLKHPVAERRVEGVQGLSHLKHWPAEEALLELLADPSPQVQRETLRALCRLGSARAVPHLIARLDRDPWELRQSAWLGLRRLTGWPWPAQPSARWRRWWASGGATHHETLLLRVLTQPVAEGPAPHDAWRALPHWVSREREDALLTLAARGDLTSEQRDALAQALERVGTIRSIPALANWRSDAAAWALGRIGGPDAEAALRRFPLTLAVLLNLDRLHSTNAGPWIPALVGQMGLVTYRGQPDDLMNAEAQPIQRVAANLIRRSGRAPELVHQVLLELEYSMHPPPATPRPPPPPEWRPMLEAMRSELKPGFAREDGVTTSQPLTALYHVATDPALVPRLKPLLRHPAFVPRIYVALTLAKLQATNTLPDLLAIIREGYPFSDAVALASGKHFDQSQTVRWRGFLCMAVGRMGGEAARVALEELASDPRQPRDIRYSSVVGLGFIGSPQSLPVLRRVAERDLIWMVREEARRAAETIQILHPAGQSARRPS